MRVKLDENLGRGVAELFLQAGHDIATVPDEGLCAATDRRLIEICRAERRCLVTLDLDFADPLVFKPANYAGIAVLRFWPRATAGDLLDAVRALISGLARETIEGRLWVVRRGRIRQYLPDEEHA